MGYSAVETRDIVIPGVPVRRPGIYYGYYGVLDDDQIERTRNHTNLLWAIPWACNDAQRLNTLNDILAAKQPTFLDVGYTLYGPGEIKDFVVNNESEIRLTNYFNQLNEAGALKYVVGIVLFDEPNVDDIKKQKLKKFTTSFITDSLNCIQRCVDKFQVLRNVKYVVTYGDGADMLCMNMFDYVGFDAYHFNSAFLRPEGPYERKIRRNLLSHQRTLIYPGGHTSANHPTPQDPTPFVNFAFRNYEVIGVIPFCWHAESHHDFETGIKDNGSLPMYEAAGKLVCGK